MKTLKDILYKVPLLSTSGDMNTPVARVVFDSREVRQGDLFVAVRGTRVDGHGFIGQAVEKGAAAIVAEEVTGNRFDIPVCIVRDSREALGRIASNYFDNPSEKLKLIAVTGTNGKTTIAWLLYHLFKKLGYNTGLMSTVHNLVNEKKSPATHTTADAVRINALLKEMVDAHCSHCFMEASSHAIDQRRIAGLRFEGAVFTNITHDHLDYHKTFDAYIKAKKQLFDELPSDAFALVNVDDRRGKVMVQNTKASVRTYSLKSMSDFKAKVLSDSFHGLELELDGQEVWFKLIGKFNAYNLTAVYGTAILLEEIREEVLTTMSSLDPVPGRFERVFELKDVMAIVDFAHTPDALQNVLETIDEIRTGNEQVITVVGAGGDRDRAKRPLMAEIACRMSDRVILTSDNPRSEDPDSIIKDMEKGVQPSCIRKTLSITDRREAIKTALMLAKEGDIILVAGKGHETYQEIKGVKYDFDDRKVLVEMMKKLSNN